MSSVAAPSMQQAFADAKVEHSEKSEQAPASEVSTAPPVAEVPAQHTDKPAGVPSSTGDPDLISDTDWAGLATLSPADQRAELNKRWTQKTQSLAAERKRLARYEPHADLLDAYDTDPSGTIRQLAEQHGLVLAPTEKPASPSEGESPYLADAKAQLGPDLDFLATPMAALLDKIVAPLKAELGTLKSQTTTIVSNASQAEVDGVMKSFEKAHPDWKEHEPAMLKLGLQPGPGMTANDYLEACYKLVTYDARISQAKVDAVTKMSKAAEAAETETPSVNGRQVTHTVPKNAGMREAHAAAKRGEVWI